MTEPQRRVLIVVLILLAAAWWMGLLGDGISFNEPGPRVLLIARESASDTAQHNLEYNKLRTGEPAKYLAEKQHKFLLLDVDLTTADGKESLLVSQFAPYGDLPELLIIDPPNKVLAREKFVDAATTIATLKANGG